jgi:hypothetical protein
MRLAARFIVTRGALCLMLTCFFVGPGKAEPRNFGGWLWNYYNNPWCIYTPDDFYDCSYQSLAQCNAARSGVGGGCYPNPRYANSQQNAQPPVSSKRRPRLDQ